jgi:hypothetical protein
MGARGALALVVAAVACAVMLVFAGPAIAQPPEPGLGVNPEYALPATGAAGPQTPDSASLVENSGAWNGHQVAFTGEAIGESMARGAMAWIHLNDDAYKDKNIEEGAELGGYNSGHAVWLPDELAGRISFFGDYKHEGDVVKVQGTFNAACPEHGGDMDIHATSLEVVTPGHTVPHTLNRTRLAVAAALFVIAGLLFYARVLARRRRI